MKIEGYQIIMEDLLNQLQAKQAQIDSLMLEYCPDEMTVEQKEEWAKHQIAGHDVNTLKKLL